MKIRLKGLYSNQGVYAKDKTRKKGVPKDMEGRTYDIGFITAGVSLTEDGLTLTVTNKELAEKLKELIGKK